MFCYLKPNKRKYRTLRIPESVAKRICQNCLVQIGVLVFIGQVCQRSPQLDNTGHDGNCAS